MVTDSIIMVMALVPVKANISTLWNPQGYVSREGAGKKRNRQGWQCRSDTCGRREGRKGWVERASDCRSVLGLTPANRESSNKSCPL